MYDKDLRYPDLYNFDEKMNHTEIAFKSMISEHQYVSMQDDISKVIVYEKGDLLFIYNFHPTDSLNDYGIGTPWQSDHFILFESDEDRYGGHRRLDGAHNMWFEVYPYECNKRPNHFKFYVPCRSCVVMCAYENAAKIMQTNPEAIDRMPSVTDRQKQQVSKLMAAQGLQDSHAKAIIKMEEQKTDTHPKETKVVKSKPIKQQQVIAEPDDITQ